MSGGGRRAALVVGGTGTIGRAVVAALAAHGWDVAVHGHAALPAARDLAAAAGGRSLAVTADLREEGAVRAVVHRVADHLGRLDAVVLCARRRVPGAFEETSASDLRTHFDVNVAGAFVVAQEAAAVMQGQEAGGTLVVVADPAGPATPGDLPHAVSRAALPGLVRCLEAEFVARGGRVRVACVEAAGEARDVAATVVAEVSRATPGCGA